MASNGGPADEGGRTARRFAFGPVVFNEQTLELTVNGAAVALERKPLEVLRYLLLHSGEVVTKDELAEACWPGRILSDTVLAKTISRLREGLGDEKQELVKTQHGYGYRLAAAVRVEAAAAAPAPHFDFKAGDAPPLRPLWKLESRLGAGGHGEAWLARHEKTREARVFKFALTGAALSSLKREITLYRLLRDTLGDRDDYVRVLDWNLDEPPYFVEFEYSNGGNLAQWAEAQGGLAGMPLSSRIAMAIRIAEALAACHSVGVLHKDLKPGNVLVVSTPGAAPAIKLADFGSGGVLDPQRLAELGITRQGFTQALAEMRTPGTAQYLAPEVMAGQPSTVQADIYALGVILYQLVVGDLSRPFASGWEQDVGDELLRQDIADATHGNPARRLTDATRLAERLSVLGPRRAQRAREAEARARADAQRLALDKLQARRSWMVASVVILAAGLWASLALYLDARNARNEAAAAAATSRAVSEFLGKDMFAPMQGEQRPVRNLTPRELLDAAAARAGERFAEAPEAAAQVHAALGSSFVSIEEAPAAEAQLDRALILFEEHAGAGSAEALQVAANLVLVKHALGKLEQLRPRFEALRAAGAARLGARHPDVLQLRLRLIGWGSLDDLVGAAQALRELTVDALVAVPPHEAIAAEAQQLRGQALVTLGQFAEAEQALLASIELQTRLHGTEHVRLAYTRLSLATALIETERFADAERELDQALTIAAHWSARDSSGLYLAVRLERASLRLRQGRLSEAASLFREALVTVDRAFVGELDESGPYRALYAEALRAQGRNAEALAAMRRALAVCERAWGADYRRSQRVRVALADLLRAQGQLAEARALLAGVKPEVFAAMPRHPMLAELRRVEGLLAAGEGHADLARAALGEALEIFEFRYGAGHRLTQRARAELARVSPASAA